MSETNNNNKPKINMPRFNLSWLYVIIAMSFGILYFSNQEGGVDKQITYTEFKDMVNKGYADKIIAYDNNTVEMFIKPEYIKDVFKNDYKKVGRSPFLNVEIGSMESLDKFLEKAQEEGHFTGSISYEKKRDYFGALFWNIAPFLLLIGIWMFAMRRMSGGGGSGGANPFNVGKSKAQVYEKGDKTNRITFKDVAGQAEAKQEVEEIVEFLKQPQKYTELGGKIPKGALLVGPPGTGKTLLAKAVAGEADVPFFSLSGSDFVEMFVGVGASRVRDLFEQAKKHQPCIIFIDEIDAVGRQRGAGLGGGHDEREQTLNQLLVEMDGFDETTNIIVIAATNRPDILDNALLRPGRFDRQIYINAPDVKGREQILNVHAKNKQISPEVDLKILAKRTPGFTGADLQNLLNEAALLAARHDKTQIEMEDIDSSIDRVIAGIEKKSKVMTEQDKELTSYHEVGHALIAKLVKDSNELHKVSIIPRGYALGITWTRPKDEKVHTSKSQLLAQITVSLGGRAAEEIVYGKDNVSTGASQDLSTVTNLARKMVTAWGMSDKLGNMTYGKNQENVFMGRDFGHQRDYSEQVAYEIDEEIKNIIDERYEYAKKLLTENRDMLEEISKELLEKETIDEKEFEEIMKRVEETR